MCVRIHSLAQPLSSVMESRLLLQMIKSLKGLGSVLKNNSQSFSGVRLTADCNENDPI